VIAPCATAAHGGFDRRLQILQIGGSALVHDDQVDCKTFHAPIFMRTQQLPDLRDVLDVVDA
jgi:hypothetical protein